MRVHLNAVTVAMPGADDWDALRAQFDAATPAPEDWQAKPECLAPRAAKRLSPQIRLALTIAERIAPSLPNDAAWVFASSIGEGETLQVILEALRTEEMMVQPLRFQNAVHNAASGQWTIAAGLTGPATSIGAYYETVGAGLLKAAMQVALEQRTVGLVCYDFPLPDPLDAIHPLGLPVGVGLALSPEATPNTIATFDVSAGDGSPTPPITDFAQTMIDTLNPIATALPLLETLAGIGPSELRLGLHGGSALHLKMNLT
jgi:hypothetical protein